MSIYFFTILIIFTKLIFVYLLSKEKRLVLIYFYSLLYTTFSWSWILLVDIGNYVNGDKLYTWFSYALFLLAAFFLSFFYCLVLLHHRFKKHYLNSIIFAFLLVVIEILTSLILNVLLLPEGYNINGIFSLLNFNFANLGYSLIYTPVSHLSYYGYVYVLTFILGLMIKFFKIDSFVKFFISIAILSLVSCYSLYFDLKSYDNNYYKFYILPEDSNYITPSLLSNNKTLNNFDYVIDGITSISPRDKTQLYNQTLILNTETGGIQYDSKYFLMPVVEYVPKIFKVLLSILDNDQFKRREYISQDTQKIILNYNNKRLGFLICSDAWSIYSALKLKNKVDVIILQRREVAFHNSNFYKANSFFWRKNLKEFLGVDIIDVVRY